jgi:hypothetical protein
LFYFYNSSPLTHPTNGIIFLDEECDVFMNESEIKMEERTKGERLGKIPSS